MKVCVLGGSGFLGSHVCDKLSEVGHEVRLNDCVRSSWLRSGQTMIEGDQLDESKLREGINDL